VIRKTLAAAAVAGLVPAAAFAQSAPAAQNHGAHVDRFLASLPPGNSPAEQAAELRKDADDKLAKLLKANPGKAAALRPLADANARCSAGVKDRMVKLSLRHAAEALSDAELDKMVEFYTGPDLARLSDDATEEQLKPLMARYPLQRFAEVMRKGVEADFDTGVAGFADCDLKLAEALGHAGLKAQDAFDAPAQKGKSR
jgi:hypothetical protein